MPGSIGRFATPGERGAIRNLARPGAIIACRARRLYFETAVDPAQCHGSRRPPFPRTNGESTAASRGVTYTDHNRRTPAVLLQGLGSLYKRDKRAVPEFADASSFIETEAVPKSYIAGRAWIAVGGEPFAKGESVTAEIGHGQLTVARSHGNRGPVRCNEKIGLWRSDHHRYCAADQRASDQPQRRFQQTKNDKPDSGKQQRTRTEGSDTP